MSDLRFDPVTHRWVAIARNRQDRPMEFVPIEQTRKQLICPFCKGNEDETPAPIAAYRADGNQMTEQDDPASWSTRIIPNKYPSLPSGSEAPGLGAGDSRFARPSGNDQVSEGHTVNGPYQSSRLPGCQELIIASPRHLTTLSELNDTELHVSFNAYQHRLRCHRDQSGIRHSMLFMNCRSSAGASLSHIHTQLIGAPIVSEQLEARRQRNLDHLQQHGVSLIEGMTQWERDEETRIVEDTDRFTVFCPFASQFPFQVWIVPKQHVERFVDCPEDMRNELAELCRFLVRQIEELLDEPGYNLLLHQAPFSMSQNDHWYFEMFPRLTRPAGFEWGTDIWVNPVAPESAAKRYRFEKRQRATDHASDFTYEI